MDATKIRLMTQDRLMLQGYIWKPGSENTPVKGVVWLVHGFGEYAGRYQRVAEQLNAAGYAVFGYDHRGHGLSDGRRGAAPSYDSYLDDLNGVRQQIAELPEFQTLSDVAKKRQFIWGHSFGGGLVLNYLLREYASRVATLPRLSGYVVTSPWLKLSNPPKKLLQIAGSLIHLIYPQFTTNANINPQDISTDPEEQRKYAEELNNPEGLLHGKISYTLFSGANEAGSYAIANARKVKTLGIPVRLLHGGSDPVTSAEASRTFAELANTGCPPEQPAVDFDLRANLRHETHNEVGREGIIKDHIQWLDQQKPVAEGEYSACEAEPKRSAG